jgi:hypothetical protein
MSPERKITQLEQKNLRLERRILSLERKMANMKAQYEAKLKAKKRIAIPEEERQKLIARRDKAIAADARLR